MACTFAGKPCLEPEQERQNARDLGHATGFWGPRANAFTNPLGPSPARGLILLSRQDLDAIDRTALHDLVFIDDLGHTATAHNLLVVRAHCAIPGYRGDPAAPYWVEVADRRHTAQATAINRSYNVRSTAGGAYLSASRNSGADWTWTTLLADLWSTVGLLGSNPGLPYTPDGAPEGFSFFAQSAYAALNQVLERLGCALAWNPAADVYTIVRLAAADSAASTALAGRDDVREWDADPIEPARAKLPYFARVHFPAQRTAADATGASPFYTIDVTDPGGTSAGVQSATYALLFDELAAQYDATGALTNSAALSSRAAALAADYFRRARQDRLDRVYIGALPDVGLQPGSQVRETVWVDRQEGPQGQLKGPTTALGRRPGLPLFPLDAGPQAPTEGGGGDGDTYYLHTDTYNTENQFYQQTYQNNNDYNTYLTQNLSALSIFIRNYLSSYGSEVCGPLNWCYVTPSAFTGQTDDWSPPLTSGQGKVVYRLSSTVDVELTGIENPGTDRVIALQNVGAFVITLTHSDVASAAANRLSLPGETDLVLGANAGCIMWYDRVDLRWKVFLPAQAGGSSSLTVEEVDGSPSYGSITTVRVDSADGFVLTQPGAGIVRIDQTPASATAPGYITTTTQQFAGVKSTDPGFGAVKNCLEADGFAFSPFLVIERTDTDGLHGYQQWRMTAAPRGSLGGIAAGGVYDGVMAWDLQGVPALWMASLGPQTYLVLPSSTSSYCVYEGTTLRVGAWATVSGLVFKGGLYISGSFSGGGGTVTSVGLIPPAAGITVSGSPVTGSGTMSLALANDLAALEGLSGTSTIYYRSGVDTWSAVTVGSGLDFTTGTLTATGAGSNVFKGALVKLTSNQSVSTTGTTLSWHVATYDTSAFWSAGAPTRLTIPTGVTRVRLKGGIDIASSTAGSRQLVITRNGGFDFPGVTQATWSNPAYGDTQMEIASPVFEVTAGDYFELFTKSSQSGLNALGTANQTWFSIEVVSTEAAAGSHTHSAADITSGTLSNARLDSTLAALAVFNTNGLIVQTAADTFVGRTLTGPAAGLTVTAGDGVTGNPTLALADDLAALEALAGTNTIYYRSAASTWTAVTIGANLTFSGGTLAADFAAFVAAGGSHAKGAVPDPGATAYPNQRRILASDATWEKNLGECLGYKEVLTSETTGSATPVDLATVQEIDFTLDESSTLMVMASAVCRNTVATGLNVLTADLDGTDGTISQTACTTAALGYPVVGQCFFTAGPGARVLKLQFSTGGGTQTGTFFSRRISVWRVG